jgi:hypothetical protein
MRPAVRSKASGLPRSEANDVFPSWAFLLLDSDCARVLERFVEGGAWASAGSRNTVYVPVTDAVKLRVTALTAQRETTRAPEGTTAGTKQRRIVWRWLPDFCTVSSADCRASYLSGVECRSSVGPCDVSEYCSGASSFCPPDQVLPAGPVCRASTASCDPAESCDGVAALCPADVDC